MFLPRREVTATGTLVLKCSWLKKTVVWEIIRVVNDGMNVFISSLMKSRRNLMKKKKSVDSKLKLSVFTEFEVVVYLTHSVGGSCQSPL